jgi:hypothetical protein
LAIALYVFVFLLAVALVSTTIVFAFRYKHPASETVETTLDAGPLKIVDRSESAKSDPSKDILVPVLTGLLAALASGGALVLPLKFTWDELSNRAAHRREVEGKIRERLNLYVEKYYVPIINALRGLTDGAHEFSQMLADEDDLSSDRGRNTLDRFLYSAAQVWKAHRDMRHAGGSWFFRSATGEIAALNAFTELRWLLNQTCEISGNERSLVARALYDLEPEELIGFQSRLHTSSEMTPDDDWLELRRYRERLQEVCGTDENRRAEDFARIADAAAYTADIIMFNSFEIYTPWYRDSAVDVIKPRIEAAEAWLRDANRKREPDIHSVSTKS